MTVSIENALPEDIPMVVAIAEVCGLSHWSSKDYLEEIVRTDSIFIKAAGDGGIVAGFLVGRYVPAAYGDGVDLGLYNIGVQPEKQKQGIGKKLMKNLIDECSQTGVRNIFLEVRASNAGAINFYRSFGFVKTGVSKLLYRDPVEDGMSMKLEMLRIKI